MVQSKNILSLVALPTLALASPSLHARHAHQHRAIKEHWVYETTVVATTTVTYGQLPAQTQAEVNANVNAVPEEVKPSSVVNVVVTPSPVAPAPQVEDVAESEPEPEPEPVEAPSTSAAPKPISTDKPSSGGYPSGVGGSFAIKNNCKYDVTMTIDRTQCGPTERDISIPSGNTWHGEITSCDGANPAYKIYKAGNGKDKRDPSKPLQLEAGFKPSQNTLWYNISPKDCVDDMYGAGIENCPGGPWYLSAKSSASNPGACQTYECHDAESCCTSSLGAYCDAWATAAKALGGLEPVGGCLGSLDQISLVAQLC